MSDPHRGIGLRPDESRRWTGWSRFAASSLFLSPLAAAAQDTLRDPGADEHVAWLKEHAVVLRTIDPADEDFSDLQPLKAAIGTARVVQLGEQSHGDGACFHAKSRIAKFLHKEMGFDLLVFESGFYDCTRAEAAFEAGEPALEAAQQGIFGIWSLSEQCRLLFEYVAATRKGEGGTGQETRPDLTGLETGPTRALEVAGFDSQFTSGDGPRHWYEERWAKRSAAMPPGAEDVNLNAIRLVMDSLVEAGSDHPSEENMAAFDREVEALDAALTRQAEAAATPEARRDILIDQRWLRNARAYASQMHWGRKTTGYAAANQRRSSDFREPFMADTLVFICRDLYPDRKIMTWGASSHLMHNSAAVDYLQQDGSYANTDGFRAMGDGVREALGDEVYTIGFIAYAGVVGRPWTGASPIAAAPVGSLDELCHFTGERFLFIDFRAVRHDPAHWLMQPQVARPRGYWPMKAVWPDVCDAMVFTDRMYPSTRAEQVERAQDP